MRIGAVLAALALTGALGGCGGDDGAEEVVPGDVGPGVAFSLDAENDSQLTGARAILTPLGTDRTRIQVDGIDRGSPAGGGPHRIQLIRGSCDENARGAVVADLGGVGNGRGGDVVQQGAATLAQGDFAVAVWLVAGQRQLIACGEVPDSLSTK
jgi:type IV pilus biogenesis protein CpaD/CtpE